MVCVISLPDILMSRLPDISVDDGLIFECQACREEPCMPRLDDLSHWARLCGYDSSCVRLCEEWNEQEAGRRCDALAGRFQPPNPMWSARRCNVTAVQSPFLETTPVAGKSYIAFVQHPFMAKKSEHFWFLFQPPFSLINGWEECTEEIYGSHLLHVAFDRALHREDKFALIVVTVQEMIAVPAIHEYFPETTGLKPFAMLDDDFARRANWVSWLSYVHVYWNPESDMGVWWLFHRDNSLSREPAFHMVMQGHWGWHDALVWTGNQRLSADEAACVRSFMHR